MSSAKKSTYGCTFFIQGNCKYGDACKFQHTRNKCEWCKTYTSEKLCQSCFQFSLQECQYCGVLSKKPYCFSCRKDFQQQKMNDKYENMIRMQNKLERYGRKCVNHQHCKGLTLKGEYCKKCFDNYAPYLSFKCIDCYISLTNGKRLCAYCKKKRDDEHSDNEREGVSYNGMTA
jgi:hypothetical protein